MSTFQYKDITNCCKDRNINYDPETNEYVCTNCALILGYSYELYPDLQNINFSNIKQIKDSSRKSLDYSTLGIDSSIIDSRNVDYMNKPVNWFFCNNLRNKDRMCVNKNQSNRHSHVKGAKKTIVLLSQKLTIPKYIADRAAQLYDKAYRAGLVKGRNIEGISATTLYIACREEGIPKHLEDFAAIMDTKVLKRKTRADGTKEIITKPRKKTKKQLFEFYQFLVDKLDLKSNIKEQSLPVEINRVGGIIKVSEKTIREAIKIAGDLKQYDETVFFGKNPLAVSACIVFMASKLLDYDRDESEKENLKQITITKNSRISIVTLRKHISAFVKIYMKNGIDLVDKLDNFIDV